MNAEFFSEVRKRFGRLSQAQVDGFNIILKAAEGRQISHIAYILATAWHETDKTMQPVRETLAKTDAQAVARLEKAWKAGKLPQVKIPYWRYDDTGRTWLGRGYVQLTHKDNYRRAAAMVGVDLLGNPSLAMRPDIAAKILVEGCAVGLFTGKPLSNYLPGDYVNARKIVNGLDHAFEIAADAEGWESALMSGGYKADTNDFRPAEPKVRDVALTVPGQREAGHAAKKPASGAKVGGVGAVIAALAAAVALAWAKFGETVNYWMGW